MILQVQLHRRALTMNTKACASKRTIGLYAVVFSATLVGSKRHYSHTDVGDTRYFSTFLRYTNCVLKHCILHTMSG